MAYGESNGHMTDDVSEVLIVTSVCLGAREALSKKVNALDRLRVRTNVILLKVKLKPNKALDENSSFRYRSSPAIWDYTATRHK